MDGRNKIDDIALGDFMNTSGAPAGDYLSAKYLRHLACGTVLRDMLRNKHLQQVIYPIGSDFPVGFSLLSGGIPAIELGGENLLGCKLRLMERNAPIRSDSVFPQACADSPVQARTAAAAALRKENFMRRTPGK